MSNDERCKNYEGCNEALLLLCGGSCNGSKKMFCYQGSEETLAYIDGVAEWFNQNIPTADLDYEAEKIAQKQQDAIYDSLSNWGAYNEFREGLQGKKEDKSPPVIR